MLIKIALVALMVLVLISLAGCLGGPNTLTRRIDDWMNAQYVESPCLAGNVVSGVLVGVWFVLARVIDGVFNFYHFWFEDAWPMGKGTGTPFIHANPPNPPLGK